jgi:hypothetical protein
MGGEEERQEVRTGSLQPLGLKSSSAVSSHGIGRVQGSGLAVLGLWLTLATCHLPQGGSGGRAAQGLQMVPAVEGLQRQQRGIQP